MARRDYEVSKSMQHWNNCQMVAIDLETTGLDPTCHEIWQLAAVALDSNFRPRKDVKYFDMLMTPDDASLIDWKVKTHQKNREQITNAIKNGVDQASGVEHFQAWIDALGLPRNMSGFNRCKVIPLGHNIGQFDIPFLKAWMGYAAYDEIFHPCYRDTMVTGAYLNDKAAMHAEKVPFSKLNLRWMCNILNVIYPEDRQHNALYDCVATAEVFQKLTQRGLVG